MITSVTELWGSRSFNLNWKTQRTYTRQFQVYVSDNSDHQLAIALSASIPQRLSSHPSDALALVKDIKVSNDQADPLRYTVDVNYDSVFEFDPATTNENPLLRPAIWTFSFEKASKAVREDLDGNAIDNSAETPIEPPLEIEQSIPIIKIEINKATFSYALISQMQDTVNLYSWNGFDAETVKVRGIEVKQMWENNYLYWAYSWTLAVKYDGWNPTKILDQGFQVLDVDGNPKIARDKFGNPFPHPVLLDGFGNKKDPADDPVFLEFTLHRTVNFAGIVP